MIKYFSAFTGIGGFEYGIDKAVQRVTKQSRSGVGLSSKRDSSNSKGKPWKNYTCIGYSEIDKYAIQIYQKHYPERITYETDKGWRTLQGTEWNSLQPKGDKSDFKSWSNKQPETWWDRKLQQPKNIITLHKNYGDITKITELPDFDLFVGGFPCQSFSIAGKRGGFNDIRGTLFFDIARICKQKQPRLLLLENVKGLLSHDKGETFATILKTLDEIGYDVQWQVLNSKDFGVPQNRERVFIVGHLRGTSRPKVFPIGESNQKPTEADAQRNDIAHTITNTDKHLGSYVAKWSKSKGYDSGKIRNEERFVVDGTTQTLSTGDGCFNFSSGNYVIPKIRRLTPTECERLQGFPDGWTEGISDTQRYKCLGNAVTTNVVSAIMKNLTIKKKMEETPNIKKFIKHYKKDIKSLAKDIDVPRKEEK